MSQFKFKKGDKAKVVTVNKKDSILRYVPNLAVGDIVTIDQNDSEAPWCLFSNNERWALNQDRLELIPTWTLEKIKNCLEIKFGTIVKRKYDLDAALMLFVRLGDDGNIDIIDQEGEYRCLSLCTLAFYRPDGSEILPPEDEAKDVNPKKVILFAFENAYDEIINWSKCDKALPVQTRRPEFDLEF
jgi:hypothetical protein